MNPEWANVPRVTLGRYRLLSVIGRGGMADVYLAAALGHAGFQKEAVVKVLKPELTASRDFVTMFTDEARLAAQLHHPNIVQTYDVGVEQGVYFLAMEYLDGQSLDRLLACLKRDGEVLPDALAVFIAREALAGLEYAHRLTDIHDVPLEIVHRDISPQNTFVTYRGEVKIVDFGVAKSAGQVALTQAGTFKGKVGYMSPEHAAGDSIDGRADLFALGVLLWEMLAGRRMWRDLPPATIAARLIAGNVPGPDQLEREVHPALRQALRRALAPDVSERYPCAAAFKADLDEYLNALAGPTPQEELGQLVHRHFQEERRTLRAEVRAQLKSLGGAVGDWSGSLSSSEGSVPKGLLSSSDQEATRVSALPTRPAGTITPACSKRRARLAAGLVAGLAVTGALGWTVVRSLHSTESAPVPRASQGLAASGAATGVVDGSGPGATFGPLSGEAPGGCGGADAPIVELTGDIDDDASLPCDRRYRLRFNVVVRPGATLTIAPGTTLVGDHETKGTLVIMPGARLIADGTRDLPIVFTSEREPSERRAGDWGGVVLMGRAPTNLRGAEGQSVRGRVEGLLRDGEYGGDDPTDSSGVLRFVRIEYPGIAIAPNNELNGLTLAGVGRGTVIEHVYVRNTVDDCFEFFGGTVDARYLVCESPGDDGVDWDFGYTGRIQFVVVMDDPLGSGGTSALEGDNDPNGSLYEPRSAPTIFNATLCGSGGHGERVTRGMHLRRATRLTLGNSLVTGFHVGREDLGESVEARLLGTAFFGQRQADYTASEAPATSLEVGVVACRSGLAAVRPREALIGGAVTPPRDAFFDAEARYLGAFRDASDGWATGAWATAR